MQFFETIRLDNGIAANTPWHIARVKATAQHHFDKVTAERLVNEFQYVFSELSRQEASWKGVHKLRVSYSGSIEEISVTPYVKPEIVTLKLVYDDNIDYSYKNADRTVLNSLFDQRDECDDVLICRQGAITDTSFCNVVFENEKGLFTTSDFLLNGTRRRQLLDMGVVSERRIRPEDLHEYRKLFLINAMLYPGDVPAIPVDTGICV